MLIAAGMIVGLVVYLVAGLNAFVPSFGFRRPMGWSPWAWGAISLVGLALLVWSAAALPKPWGLA